MTTTPPAEHDPTGDDRSSDRLHWAATYRIGRNLHFIRGWQEVVKTIAAQQGRRWEQLSSYAIFCPDCHVPPDELFFEINESLRNLVIGGRMDAAALVELHRMLDASSGHCDQMAELVSLDDREEIIEISWDAGYDWHCAHELSSGLLKPDCPYRLLGDCLGDYLSVLLSFYDPTLCQVKLKSLISAANDCEFLGDVVSPLAGLERDVASLKSRPYSMQGHSCMTENHLEVLVALDNKITSALEVAEAMEPVVILDDKKKRLVFLGTSIPFTSFKEANASGGLDLFRQLVRCPDEYVDAETLATRADSDREADGIKEYLTRFRGVIKKAAMLGEYKESTIVGRRSASMAFVVASRQSKKTIVSMPKYKLDLPRQLVRYIPAPTD